MKHLNLKKVLSAVIALVMLVCCALINVNAKAILRGDVNMDNEITAADARLVLRHSAQISLLEGEALIAADVDENGEIIASDARKILRVAAELDKFVPAEIVIEDETDVQEPTDEETTTQEPTTEEPTTEEPTTEEPTTEEPTTEEPTTVVPAVDDKGRTIVTEYPDVIDSLFNKKFYLDCNSDIDGNSTPMVFAMDGKNIEVIASMDGQKTSMMIKTEKNLFGIEKKVIYMKMVYDGTPCYLKLDETTLKILGMDDFDIDSITDAFNFGSVTDYSYIVCYTEEISGAEHTVYGFVEKTGSELCFCFDAEENVKYLIIKNSAGEVIEKYNVNTLTGTLPSDVFSLDGYKQLDILDILSGAM